MILPTLAMIKKGSFFTSTPPSTSKSLAKISENLMVIAVSSLVINASVPATGKSLIGLIVRLMVDKLDKAPSLSLI